MSKIVIQAGKSYLVETTYGSGQVFIQKMTVKEVTETSYKIKWENGDSDIWLRKSEFERIGYTDPKLNVIECLNASSINAL